MDKIDHKILQYLQEDADITNAALAEKVFLAPSSCLRRVQRLKKAGVIQKLVAVVDEVAVGRNLKAVVEVDLERHGTSSKAVFLESVRKEPAITQAHLISGESDVLLILSMADMKEYREVCDRVFHNDENVIRFRTSFVMETVK